MTLNEYVKSFLKEKFGDKRKIFNNTLIASLIMSYLIIMESSLIENTIIERFLICISPFVAYYILFFIVYKIISIKQRDD